MSTVYMLLAFGFVLPLGSIGLDLRFETKGRRPLGMHNAKPESEREAEIIGRHRAPVVAEPVMGPMLALPRRPEGRAALKAEIRLAPLGKTPPLRTRKDHPDWAWNTDEHRLVVESFFDGLPDDQAVMRVEVRV